MVSSLSTIVLLLTIFTETVLTDCSTGCTTCSGSTCLKCNSSYYLSSGFCSSCPEDCTSCNGYYNCTSCKPGKWGSYSPCGLTCVDSCYNTECQYDTGFCVQCKRGLYGLMCKRDCSDCADDLCDLRRCTHGCKQGYYEYKTESESICQSCPTNCRNCSDSRTCRVCIDGFHLYQFHISGKTNVQCLRCSLESKCSNFCVIQNCSQCEVNAGILLCTDCLKGYRFNGKTCILNTTSCSRECFSYCNDNGICVGSCNAGWTGEKCSDQCSDNCLTCDKSSWNICQQCKGDFYTINCTAACSPSCIAKKGKQTCRVNDGYCLNGCEYNFWGPVCDQPCSDGCSNAGSSPCERSNGTCEYGCKDGYSGKKCDTDITRKTTVKSEATTTTQKQISTQRVYEENGGCRSNFIEGYFSGNISKRLKSRQDSKTTIEMPTYYNADVGQTNEMQEAANETNNYERLDNTRNTENVYNSMTAFE